MDVGRKTIETRRSEKLVFLHSHSHYMLLTEAVYLQIFNLVVISLSVPFWPESPRSRHQSNLVCSFTSSSRAIVSNNQLTDILKAERISVNARETGVSKRAKIYVHCFNKKIITVYLAKLN